jgi:ribosomal 50S subunit-associated protein YjgA (DUF615 family)
MDQPSKSERKRQAAALQDLGTRLPSVRSRTNGWGALKIFH